MSGCYRRHAFIATKKVPGLPGLVLIDYSQAKSVPRLYRLNEVGALVWHLLDGKTTLRQLAQGVCEEYAADPRQTETDIARFLQILAAAGFIYCEASVTCENTTQKHRY